MPVSTARVAVPEASALGEGPLWDAPGERLLRVDITGGTINAYAPATAATTSVALGQEVGFVVADVAGGDVAGTASGLLPLDADLRPRGKLAAPGDLDHGRRINDGACDPRDAVQGVHRALTETGGASGRAYNIAAATPTSARDGAALPSEVFGVPTLRVEMPMTFRLELAIDAARAELRYEPAHDFRSMVETATASGSALAEFIPARISA